MHDGTELRQPLLPQQASRAGAASVSAMAAPSGRGSNPPARPPVHNGGASPAAPLSRAARDKAISTALVELQGLDETLRYSPVELLGLRHKEAVVELVSTDCMVALSAVPWELGLRKV